MQAQEEHNCEQECCECEGQLGYSHTSSHFATMTYYHLSAKKRALQCSLNEALVGSAHM